MFYFSCGKSKSGVCLLQFKEKLEDNQEENSNFKIAVFRSV